MFHSYLVVTFLVAAVALLMTGCGGNPGTGGVSPAAEGMTKVVFWQEGENYAAASQAVAENVADKAPASAGRSLAGVALAKKGDFVRYEFDLPQPLADAKLVLRYARAHWRKTMVPARLTVEVSDRSGTTLQTEATFPETGGWGERPSDWGLATVALKSLQAGPCTLKLISLADDNDVNLDGFFVAPVGFAITAEELALSRVAISSDGYLGLYSPATLRQDLDRSLSLSARAFTTSAGSITINRAVLTRTNPSPAEQPKTQTLETTRGKEKLTVKLPMLDDGSYLVEVESSLPHSRIVAPLVLAGQFLGTLNGKVAALEAFSATLARSKKPAEVECLADFQHAIEYLKTSGRKLSAAAGGDAQQRALAAKEGLTNPAPVVDGMRKVLAQAEETMRRLKAGQDPYAGRTGDLRRAFRSDVSGELQVYRVYVPSGYAKAEKVPLLLMLHGGGDENSFPDLDGGKLLEMLDQRGYLMVSPRGQLRLNPNFLSDNRQLIELTRQHYPKIDPSRIYCTGLSAGGFGTYTMATTYPDLFAAICCVSGTGDAALADKLKTVPTLIFQGGLDAVVPPAGARKVAARMKELGETVDLRIFPAYGHDYRGPEYLKLSLDFFDRYARK